MHCKHRHSQRIVKDALTAPWKEEKRALQPSVFQLGPLRGPVRLRGVEQVVHDLQWIEGSECLGSKNQSTAMASVDSRAYQRPPAKANIVLQP